MSRSDLSALRRRPTLVVVGLTAVLALTTACTSGGGANPSDPTSAAASDDATSDAGAGGSGPAGTLRIGFLHPPSAPDPDRFYGASGLMITLNAYEGLVQYEQGDHESAELVPSLATEWSVSDDNTEYSFTLREGVTFADGTPMNAKAVEASLQRRIDVAAGVAYLAGDIEKIEIIDDTHLTVKLANPNSAYLDFLASPYGVKIINPTIIEQHPDDLGQAYLTEHTAGTGPYQMTVAETDTRYQLTYNENYWGGQTPAITTVDITVYADTSAYEMALESGDEDLIIGSIASSSQGKYLEHATLKAYSLPTFQIGLVYMNPYRDFFATPEARTAFYQSVDWAQIVADVIPNKGTLATGRFSRGAVPGDSIDFVYDPAPFAEYVATLPAGTAVEIGYQEVSEDDGVIAEIVAAQLQALGLQASASARSESEVYGTWFNDRTAAPDLMIQSNTWPDANNGYAFGHVFWDADGGLNYFGCSTDEIRDNLEQGLATGDDQFYRAAADAAWAAGCNPTWDYGSDFVAAQARVGGIEAAHTIAEPYSLNIYDLTLN